MYVQCRSNRNLCKIATVLPTDKFCHIASKQRLVSCITYNTVQNNINSQYLRSTGNSASGNELYLPCLHQASKHYPITAKHHNNAHCKPLEPLTSHVLSLVYSILAQIISLPYSVSAIYNRRWSSRGGAGFKANQIFEY